MNITYISIVPEAFRIKHGKSVKHRVDKENEELEAQKRKEEMGKF